MQFAKRAGYAESAVKYVPFSSEREAYPSHCPPFSKFSRIV